MILSDKLALVSYSFVSMSQFFFIILLIIATIIRIPLSILIIILRPLVPFLKKRLDFERQNLISESAKSHNRAHYCFEVSSEGELEQVRPLIEAVLANGKSIEIIYSSPSVENKCQNFYKTHSSQVKLLRMPLLSGWPFPFLYFQSVWTWVSAPVIVFCRYDFFPELLLLKLFGKRFVLVSGAFKKMSWYKRESFKLFDVVIAATDLEKKNFETLLGASKKIYSCDFRVPRITERFTKASATLEKKTSLAGYIEKLKAMRPEEKIIMGSVWPSDMQVLQNPELIAEVKAGKRHLLLAPHKLDAAFVNSLKLTCDSLFGESLVEVVNDETPYQSASVVILQMSGILCELYSLFHQTYVGGGYERSIHSVLEPFFSDNMVVIGPLIHRSTEYDLASLLAPDEIHVLNNPDSFYTIIEHNDLSKLKLAERESFRQKAKAQMSIIINEILG